MDASQIPTRFKIVTGNDSQTQHGYAIIYDGGAVTLETQGGDTVVLPAVWAGTIFPIQVRKVLATGTTATSIGLFR